MRANSAAVVLGSELGPSGRARWRRWLGLPSAGSGSCLRALALGADDLAPQQRPAHAWPAIGRAAWTDSRCDVSHVLLSPRAERPPPSDTETTPSPLCPTAAAGHPTRSQARPLGGHTGSSPRGAHRPSPVPAARTRPEWCACARFDRLTPPSRLGGGGLKRPVRSAPQQCSLFVCGQIVTIAIVG